MRGCTFACGANDLETITVAAAGLHTTIAGNRFYVTANGPDAAIEIESAAAHFITISSNVFHGQNATNQWDVGAINSAVAHLDCVVVVTLAPMARLLFFRCGNGHDLLM